MNKGLPMTCTVNPAVSREREWGIGSITRAAMKKKVLIVGGGPAGLESARIAAERGHDVVIYEKSKVLGGQVLLAGMLPGRSDIKAMVNWQIDQIKKLGVQVKFGLEVSPDADIVRFVLEEERPDVVVVATGSKSIRTGFSPYTFNDIEGWDQQNVCTDIDVLEDRVRLGHKIMIADTLSFIEAPGIAELLAKQGRDVEIITFHATVALELKMINHWEHLFPRLAAAKIKVTPMTWIKRIDGNSVTLYNVYYEQEETIVESVDNVILITGKMQNDSLYWAFKGKTKELYLAGDANIGGARLGNAIYDGQNIGRKL